VIACDIADVFLGDESLDLAVSCPSLMGASFTDDIREAHRCLRDAAGGVGDPDDRLTIEREKGFEPSTSTLARLHSTTELLPRGWVLF
jgi:hypothetical protein